MPQIIPDTFMIVLVIAIPPLKQEARIFTVPPADYDCLWQVPDMGQLPQLHPQEDFPCFLSFRIRATISTTSPISARLIRIVPALSMIH
jgi:hypothetical protein